MIPIVILPGLTGAEDSATWAWYGACQALEMLGLSYEEAHGGRPEGLTIDPARGQICVGCLPEGEVAGVAAADLLRLEHYAVFHLGEVETDLPVLGPLRISPEGQAIGEVHSLDTGETAGPFMAISEADGGGWRVHFSARLFETVALYLSRFSWPGNASFNAFVREVDDLWDGGLRERWGGRAIVNEYLQILAGVLCECFEELELVMATKWQHPYRDGRVMRHGLLVSHDVDQLFSDPSFRTKLDQTGNHRWYLPKWREFETELGVRSVFYFYSMMPGEQYWFDPNYRLDDPAVLEQAHKLLEGGWEVSLHQITETPERAVALENEFFAQTFGRPTTGTRSHYLKHTFDTLSYKARAGLRYDSTWYAEQESSGFLCGSTLPYRPLDCQTQQSVGLWEFPFVIEDGNVFGVYGDGTGRQVDGAISDGVRVMDQIIAHCGYVCFNWHQRTFSHMAAYPEVADSWPPALAGLIRYLREQSPAVWNPLPIELADWWSAREQVQVESLPGRVVVRNAGPADCDDFVVCLQRPVGTAALAAERLGYMGSRELYAVPVGVTAGAEQVFEVNEEE